MFKLSIFRVILKTQVQKFVNSLPFKNFNNSFVFYFQPGFFGALHSPKPLAFYDVLLCHAHSRVRVNPNLISEDAVGLQINIYDIYPISKSSVKFSSF